MEILKKSEIRNQIRKQRLALTEEIKSRLDEVIWQRMQAHSGFLAAGNVYCYVDCRNEAGTGKILSYLWSHNIPAAVPKVFGKELRFYYVNSYDDLEPGNMGILEPKTGCESAEAHCTDSFVIVPGVAFDKSGNRLGYGGGYYDRFFTKEPEHYRLGIAYDFQIFNQLPVEHGDKTADEVLTPGLHVISESRS